MLRFSALLVLVVGCSAELGGDLLVDGQSFKPSACRSGQASGFAGVDLSDEGGRKLRLVTMPDGQAEVFLFAAGADQGEKLGACGPFTLQMQTSTINSIKNVMGKSTLDCASDGHTVKGSVTFKNCH